MPVVNPGAVTPVVPSGSTAPCGWELDTTCVADWASFSNATRTAATSWATQILWALTGRRFGACEVTIRPCGATCSVYGGFMSWQVDRDTRGGWGGTWTPFIRDGVWYNCGCGTICRCEPRSQVWLPGPVAGVTEVVVDGAVIDPANYRVDNRTWLVGLNGQVWPECQNLDLESPELGTFQVTYLRGTPLPEAGKIAAGLLAGEFARACGGGSCSLPDNLASLARQGIEVTTIDPTEVTQAGLTGNQTVDLWIRSVNPSRLQRRPRVWSPDIDVPRMRTS